MSYLNSVTIVGFVGADPEQRQARNNGSKFTVLSVATQRSWKNTEDEWVSKIEWHRVAIFRPRLAETVATTIKKGAHVLVEGELVSSDLRAPERQEQEVGDDQDHVVVASVLTSCASSIAANPSRRRSPLPPSASAQAPESSEEIHY